MNNYVFLNYFTSENPRRRYEYLQNLKRSGCKFLVVIVTHSSGNNAGNVHFTWQVPSTEPLETIMD